jgi:O-antigen/teichoic acid export membrane protein
MEKSKVEDVNRLALKSGSSYMLSNILISATSIITAPIFTRLLSTADYGIASNFAAWLNIGLVIIGLGLPYSIGNAKVDFPNELNKYLASIQTLGSLVAVTVLLIVLRFRSQVSGWMAIDENLVILIFVYLLFFPSVTFAQERYKFILQYKQNLYISFINTFGAIAFCLFFIICVFDEHRYYGRIIGLILSMFFLGIFFYIKILRDGWSKNIKKYWVYALKIALPMIPHSLAMVVLTQIDRIMITKICGNSDVGLYSFGFSYAILLTLFSNAILQAYQPWLYIKYKLDDLDSIKQSNNLIASAICIVTLGIVAVAPEAIMVLGAKSFWPAKFVVLPIAIGSLFQYVYNTYTGIELYHKKTIIIAIGTIFAAIINYVLNSFFIPIFGYIAAAYATWASYLILAIFHLFAYQKITKKRIYDDKYIWIICTVTCIASFIFMELYEYFFLRYLLLIIILAIIGFTQKTKLIKVYKLVFNKQASEENFSV